MYTFINWLEHEEPLLDIIRKIHASKERLFGNSSSSLRSIIEWKRIYNWAVSKTLLTAECNRWEYLRDFIWIREFEYTIDGLKEANYRRVFYLWSKIDVIIMDIARNNLHVSEYINNDRAFSLQANLHFALQPPATEIKNVSTSSKKARSRKQRARARMNSKNDPDTQNSKKRGLSEIPKTKGTDAAAKNENRNKNKEIINDNSVSKIFPCATSTPLPAPKNAVPKSASINKRKFNEIVYDERNPAKKVKLSKAMKKSLLAEKNNSNQQDVTKQVKVPPKVLALEGAEVNLEKNSPIENDVERLEASIKGASVVANKTLNCTSNNAAEIRNRTFELVLPKIVEVNDIVDRISTLEKENDSILNKDKELKKLWFELEDHVKYIREVQNTITLEMHSHENDKLVESLLLDAAVQDASVSVMTEEIASVAPVLMQPEGTQNQLQNEETQSFTEPQLMLNIHHSDVQEVLNLNKEKLKLEIKVMDLNLEKAKLELEVLQKFRSTHG